MVDLVVKSSLEVLRDFNIKHKPIEFIYSGSDFAYECPDKIQLNVSRIHQVPNRTVEWISRFVFGIIIHEVVSHIKTTFPPAFRVRQALVKFYSKDEWEAENLPLHFQIALWGDEECRSRLRQYGYGEKLEKFESLRRIVCDRIRWRLS